MPPRLDLPVSEHEIEIWLGEQQPSHDPPEPAAVFVLDMLVHLSLGFAERRKPVSMLPLLCRPDSLHIGKAILRHVAMYGSPPERQRANPQSEFRSRTVREGFD